MIKASMLDKYPQEKLQLLYLILQESSHGHHGMEELDRGYLCFQIKEVLVFSESRQGFYLNFCVQTSVKILKSNAIKTIQLFKKIINILTLSPACLIP